MQAELEGRALQLVASHVGYRLEEARLRGAVVSALQERGWYLRSRALSKARKEALQALFTRPNRQTAEQVREVEAQRKALAAERAEIVAPYAPTLQLIRRGRQLLEQVAFPQVLEEAGVQPIRPQL